MHGLATLNIFYESVLSNVDVFKVSNFITYSVGFHDAILAWDGLLLYIDLLNEISQKRRNQEFADKIALFTKYCVIKNGT
jgi:hypothetical protein